MQTPWAGFSRHEPVIPPYCLIARLPCYVPGT